MMAALTRRSLLGLSLFQSALLLGTKSFAFSDKASNNKALTFLSAATDSGGRHWLKAFSIFGESLSPLYNYQLRERGHAVVLNNQADTFIAVARRPGSFLVLGDVETGKIWGEVQAPEGRHFYGHGVFSADDNFFYTTESVYDDKQGDSGRIGVWKFKQTDLGAAIERVGEFRSYGVGPHELLLMPDQETLVVANGGIRTHPSLGREKLNIDSMQPSLVYVSRENGALLEQRYLPVEFHQASIRHIDLNFDGQVAVSMQFEGEPFLRVPLVATHERGKQINPMYAPENVQSQMQQYVGSVRYDLSGRFFVASCPRANMLTFWDVENGEFIRQVRARDACGVCAFENGFIYSSGSGQIRYFDLLEQDIQEFSMSDELSKGVFWDNHLVVNS